MAIHKAQLIDNVDLYLAAKALSRYAVQLENEIKTMPLGRERRRKQALWADCTRASFKLFAVLDTEQA